MKALSPDFRPINLRKLLFLLAHAGQRLSLFPPVSAQKPSQRNQRNSSRVCAEDLLYRIVRLFIVTVMHRLVKLLEIAPGSNMKTLTIISAGSRRR
jgi:hypothetical protein